MSIESALRELTDNPDFRVLKRVAERFEQLDSHDPRLFTAAIVDLETMGMDAGSDAILEIGLLSFAFNNLDGIVAVLDTYNELNDPEKPIPAEITKITGITDEDVKGKAIDWMRVFDILQKSHVIICHNSSFDRNFLELRTPSHIGSLIEGKPFACTIKDIDWRGRGYESSKLDYLNFKLGYFYSGHRAIVDCWATLNLLVQEPGSFDELKANVKRKETLLCAVNAPFDKKDFLKARHYRWSDGAGRLPKCWWTVIKNEDYADECLWLDSEIYGRDNASASLPMIEISAHKRYSWRAEQIE